MYVCMYVCIIKPNIICLNAYAVEALSTHRTSGSVQSTSWGRLNLWVDLLGNLKSYISDYFEFKHKFGLESNLDPIYLTLQIKFNQKLLSCVP